MGDGQSELSSIVWYRTGQWLHRVKRPGRAKKTVYSGKEPAGGCANRRGFLRSMESAIPPAGGMALGVDRLVMLATEANSIDEVLPFPFA